MSGGDVTVTTIPAQPGYSVAYKGSSGAVLDEVVAWLIETFRGDEVHVVVTPIAPAGAPSHGVPYGLVKPNGTVETADMIFDSVHDWLNGKDG